MKYGIIIPITTALSACAQTQPIPVPEIIHQKTWVPLPATLTLPVKADLYPGITYGEALGSLKAGLDTCNSQLGAISTLKPP